MTEKNNVVSWQWFDGMSFFIKKLVLQGKKEKYTLQYAAEYKGEEFDSNGKTNMGNK